ncbi:YggT family protein [bacterium]|nr:YggT family protein [bacterium]
MPHYIGADFGGAFSFALLNVLQMIISMVYFIIIIRVLLSWVNPDPYNPIVQIIYGITEPILKPFRRILPPIRGLDLSPILLILALVFIQTFLARLF